MAPHPPVARSTRGRRRRFSLETALIKQETCLIMNRSQTILRTAFSGALLMCARSTLAVALTPRRHVLRRRTTTTSAAAAEHRRVRGGCPLRARRPHQQQDRDHYRCSVWASQQQAALTRRTGVPPLWRVQVFITSIRRGNQHHGKCQLTGTPIGAAILIRGRPPPGRLPVRSWAVRSAPQPMPRARQPRTPWWSGPPCARGARTECRELPARHRRVPGCARLQRAVSSVRRLMHTGLPLACVLACCLQRAGTVRITLTAHGGAGRFDARAARITIRVTIIATTTRRAACVHQLPLPVLINASGHYCSRAGCGMRRAGRASSWCRPQSGVLPSGAAVLHDDPGTAARRICQRYLLRLESITVGYEVVEPPADVEQRRRRSRRRAMNCSCTRSAAGRETAVDQTSTSATIGSSAQADSTPHSPAAA